MESKNKSSGSNLIDQISYFSTFLITFCYHNLCFALYIATNSLQRFRIRYSEWDSDLRHRDEFVYIRKGVADFFKRES